MDPLTLLREFVMAGRLSEVVEEGPVIKFGDDYSFDKKMLTAYKSNQGKGDFYDLQCVLFSIQSQNLSSMDYFKAAKDQGLMSVKILDRKDLSSYLTGARATSNFIRAHELPDLAAGGASAKPAQVGSAAGPSAAAAAAAAPGAEHAAEQTANRAITANERQLRDRNSMLSVPGKTFESCLQVLVGAEKEEAQRQKAERRKREHEEAERKRQEKKQKRPEAQPSGRYQRETAPDAALKQIGAQDLGLQSMGFAAPAGPSSSAVPPPPPPRAAAVPPPPPPPPSSSSRPPAEAEKGKERPSSSSRHHHEQQQRKKEHLDKKKNTRTSIIMVPPAASALLNMFNAPEFLEMGVFRTREEAEAAGAKLPPHGYHRFFRTSGRDHPGVKYHITDKEPKNKADWEHVVAVFCLGKPWQFKRFPFPGAANGDMVDTFQRVCGVYLHYADEPVDPQVKKWNVKLIKISRHGREGDAEAARDFWSHLDAFLMARR